MKTMTVYVDKLREYPKELQTIRFMKDRKWCHMLADTSEELDNFAGELGLKFSWKQDPESKMPHYDLTEGKRNQALKIGAIEISDEDLVKFIRKTRS